MPSPHRRRWRILTWLKQYQATITPEDLAAYLYVFSSDYFEGRETAARGQKLAATYLAGQYRKLGLEPKGTVEADAPYAPEAYFQPFTVYGQRLEEASLSVMAGGDTGATATFSPTAADGQAFLLAGNAPDARGNVVFAGYGIADDDLGYNDLEALREADVDFSGKWVLLLRDEPLANDSTSLFPTSDEAPSTWTTQPFSKISAIFNTDVPAGVLIVGDTGPRATESMSAQVQAAATAAREGIGSLSLSPPDGGGGRTIPPVYTISTELANEILSPSGRTVQEVQQEIDETLQPVVFALPDVQVESSIEREPFEAQTENVLAFIEGSDPALKDEVVVLSSHYDHIGIDPTLGEDTINNGADDDGSGTVALLEIAEAFMKAKEDGHGPRRSILFLHVAGEEKGLLGSAYYADTEPVFPIDQTVTNLNIDMIGRFDPTQESGSENYVYIIGSNLISKETRPDQHGRQQSHRNRPGTGRAVQLKGRPEPVLRPERPLELRQAGHPVHLLLHRHARRLPRPQRRSRQDRVRPDGAHRTSRLRHRLASRQPGRAARRSQGKGLTRRSEIRRQRIEGRSLQARPQRLLGYLAGRAGRRREAVLA